MAISVVSPIPGQKVGDRYGARPSFPLPGGGRTIPFHYGQDYPAPRGTKIKAAHPGRVLRAGWDNGNVNIWPLLPRGVTYGGGWWVWIENEGLITIYMHMKSEPFANEGDWVGQGAALGEVGATGAANGDHLHFETLLGGTHVDPATVIGGQVSAGKQVQAANAATPGKGNEMFMIALKNGAGKETLFAVVGPNFWLEFTGQSAANNLIKQITGSATNPALVVTKDFWAHCKRSATTGKNK